MSISARRTVHGVSGGVEKILSAFRQKADSATISPKLKQLRKVMIHSYRLQCVTLIHSASYSSMCCRKRLVMQSVGGEARWCSTPPVLRQ